MPHFICTKTDITVAFDSGDTFTTLSTHDSYPNIIKAVAAKKWDEVYKMMNPVVEAKKVLSSVDYKGHNVTITHGVVTLNGTPVHNTLTERMIEMINMGIGVEPFMKFLVNVNLNPSHTAVTELYDFLEHSKLPITEDGCILAYKRVTGDYKDIYTKKVDNSIGAVVVMNRKHVDDDRRRTCSSGLHFCSREYLPHYGTDTGSRTVIVKVNPKDVVSIPPDYNNSKVRCCEYVVVGELEHKKEAPLEKVYMPTPTAPRAAPAPRSRDYLKALLASGNFKLIKRTRIGGSGGNPVRTFKTVDEVKRYCISYGEPYAYVRRCLIGERKNTLGATWQIVE